MENFEKMPTGQLLQDFRDTCSLLGKAPTVTLVKRADALQAEIDRRCAW